MAAFWFIRGVGVICTSFFGTRDWSVKDTTYRYLPGTCRSKRYQIRNVFAVPLLACRGVVRVCVVGFRLFSDKNEKEGTSLFST